MAIDYSAPEYGHPLPDDPSKPFDPKEIFHYVLLLKQADDGSVKFDVESKQVNLPANTSAAQFIATYAVTPPATISGQVVQTPWDISVQGQQAYVVLELDPRVPNWQFVGQGVMSKKPTKGKDFGLYWVTAGDSGGTANRRIASGDIDEDGCKRLYFGVAERRQGARGHHLNIFTGFLQKTMLMPVIFDPDVRNQGNTLPPPGSGGSLLIASKGKGEDVLA